MTNVYAWPPVRAKGCYFTAQQPISKSRGMQGGDVVSTAWRERRVARLVVIGTVEGGGGYVEALKRLLKGGVHLVRLTTLPAHWHLRWQKPRGVSEPIAWETGAAPLGWETGASPLTWTAGLALYGALVADPPFQALDVSGFLPGQVAAYPDEVVQVGAVTTRSLTYAVADASGVARLRVLDDLAVGGDVTIGVRETGVYRIEGDIGTFQTVGQGYEYDLSFREVFEDETDGFVEVNPWR